MTGSLLGKARVARTRRAQLAVVTLVLLSPAAWASTNTNLTMLETPLQVLQSSLTGPVALAIGIMAIAITGGMLIFNGELSDFAKRLIYAVLVAGVLLTANTVVHVLFTNASATIL
jgi:type IV secretion system protein VirB2